MHQKSTTAASAQSASIENDEECEDTRRDEGTDRTLRNPFEDDGEDDVDDDSDDGMSGEGGDADAWASRTSRGSWWRGTLPRGQERFGDGRDDSDSDREDQAEAEDDDDDFGDFAMPEADKDNDQTKASVIVKPLPVHPPPHNPKSSAFTSLWPFGSKEKPRGEETATESTGETSHDHGEKVKATHEATRRTSIEDPDEDEVVL
jgi:hypothetical protein